jgi:hypothetical protein
LNQFLANPILAPVGLSGISVHFRVWKPLSCALACIDQSRTVWSCHGCWLQRQHRNACRPDRKACVLSLWGSILGHSAWPLEWFPESPTSPCRAFVLVPSLMLPYWDRAEQDATQATRQLQRRSMPACSGPAFFRAESLRARSIEAASPNSVRCRAPSDRYISKESAS